MFQGSLLCDRPVSGNNPSWLGLLRRFLRSFSFLSLERIKQRLRTPSTENPLTIAISFTILGQLKSFLAKLGKHVTL